MEKLPIKKLKSTDNTDSGDKIDILDRFKII